MAVRFSIFLASWVVACGFSIPSKAADLAYVTTSFTPNGWATLDSLTYTGTGSRAIRFQTGASGPFFIDRFDTVFQAVGNVPGDVYTFRIDLRNASATSPGSTLYASDVVTWTTPDTSGSPQNVNLSATDIPNIAAYSLASSASYSFAFFNLKKNGATSNSVLLARNSTLAPASTVTYGSGFSNAGFYSGTSVYSGSMAISFGRAVVPEPSTIVLAAIGACVMAAMARIRWMKCSA